jgi:hypothetical protein
VRKSWVLRFATAFSVTVAGCGGTVRDAGHEEGTPEPSSKDAGSDGSAPAKSSGTGGSGPVANASGGATTSAAGATATGGATATPTDGGYFGPLDCDGGCSRFTWESVESFECPGPADRGAGGPVIYLGCGYIGVGISGTFGRSVVYWYDQTTGTLVGIFPAGNLARPMGQIPKCDFVTCYACDPVQGRASFPLQCQGPNGFYPYDPRTAQ